MHSVFGSFNMKTFHVYLNLWRQWGEGVKWLISFAFTIFNITMHSVLHHHLYCISVNVTISLVLNDHICQYICKHLQPLNKALDTFFLYPFSCWVQHKTTHSIIIITFTCFKYHHSKFSHYSIVVRTNCEMFMKRQFYCNEQNNL